MHLALYLLLAGAALALQTAWPPAWRLQGVRPDLLLLVCLHHALYGPARTVPAVAGVLGLCRDALSGAGLGPGACLFTAGAVLVRRGRRAVHRDEWIPRLLAAFVLEVCVEGLGGLRVALLGGQVGWGRVMDAGIYTAAAGLAVMALMDVLRLLPGIHAGPSPAPRRTH